MSRTLSEYTGSRDNNFNLIRFFAATLVLYSHSFALSLGTGDAEPLKNLIGMTWGTIAVDVFFVTSGFLIANSFFERRSIISFAWARILRIYPAIVVATIFCVFVIGLAITTNRPSDYLLHPQTHHFLLKNIIVFSGIEFYLPGVFTNTPYKNMVNGSLWTLPYELKMYGCLAIIGASVIFIQKRLRKNILVFFFVMIAIASVSANIINHFHAFMSDDFIRLFSIFFVGAAFYICRDRVHISSGAFFLILMATLASSFDKDVFFILYTFSLPYLIFYLAYVPSGAIRNFNKSGDYSYGIYIYAWPVQQTIVTTIPNISATPMALISFCITLALAYLSWNLVEKKCLRLKNKYIHIENMLKYRNNV